MKADFYVGKEWLGSLSKKGSIYEIPLEILIQINKTTYEEYVIQFLEDRNGIISQNDKSKWPWIWDDSKMTDFTYIFDTNEERVYVSMNGSMLIDPIKLRQGYGLLEAGVYLEYDFPNMKVDLEKIKELISG